MRKVILTMTENEKYQIIKKLVKTKLLVLNLYQTKYYKANLTHYQELLSEIEDINISISYIAPILRKECIFSPKAHKITKKKVKKELKTLKSKAKTK